MIPNATSTSSFHRKIKSPYIMQYMLFQQRMNDPNKQKKMFPFRGRNGKSARSQCKTQQNENNGTLTIVREIIKNKNKVWEDDKENQANQDYEHLTNIKSILERIKSRSIQSNKVTLQQSRDLNTLDGQSDINSVGISVATQQINSRAISEKLFNVPAKTKMEVLNFLQYKKGKKVMLSKFKRI